MDRLPPPDKWLNWTARSNQRKIAYFGGYALIVKRLPTGRWFAKISYWHDMFRAVEEPVGGVDPNLGLHATELGAKRALVEEAYIRLSKDLERALDMLTHPDLLEDKLSAPRRLSGAAREMAKRAAAMGLITGPGGHLDPKGTPAKQQKHYDRARDKTCQTKLRKPR